MTKTVVFASLIGSIVGGIVYFLFPDAYSFLLQYQLINYQEVNPVTDYYTIRGGTFMNILPLFMVVFGVIGGLFGLILDTIRSSVQKKKEL